MIDSRKLARIRSRVVGGYLSKLGYAATGKEYLAKLGPQLRYVSFSPAKTARPLSQYRPALRFFFRPSSLLFGLARGFQAKCAVSSARSNP
jgi:hypothetical protein